MKDWGEDSLTKRSKVGEIGVACGLNGCESLSPAGTFIPCQSAETDFVDETNRVDGWTGDHEGYFQLA